MLVAISLGSVIDKCIHLLSWLEQGANKANVVGLIPLFPRAFTSALDSMILVCPDSEYSVILLILFNTNTLQVSLWKEMFINPS